MTWDVHPALDDATATGSLEAPDTSAAPAPCADKKERKREAKRLRDAQRQPDSFERFKILLQVIGEQRHVVDLEDHRARYAMIIMGAVNAAVLLVGSRIATKGHLMAVLPQWLMAVILVYLAATMLFIVAVVDCLRPRALHRRGLLHWEGALRHSVHEYEAAWSEVRMDQLNREAANVAHMLAHLIHAKYRANRRLYTVLVVLIGLGAVLLMILGKLVALG
jgi:hypothetical protein